MVTKNPDSIMNPPLVVTKYDPNDFGRLANLKPVNFSTTSVSEVPFDPGTSEPYPPGARFNKDLWQRQFLYLFDVKKLTVPSDLGKSLKIVGSLETYNETGVLVEYGDPDRLSEPRDFSIEGAVAAEAVSFDGSDNVVLQTTTTQPQDDTPYARLNQTWVRTATVNEDGKVPAAEHSDTADNATNATKAINAINAENAENADNAVNAQNAQNAVNAQTANSALTAGTAGSADTANTANRLTTGRIIELTGDATGQATFDGSVNIQIPVQIAGGGGGTGDVGSIDLGAKKIRWGIANLPITAGSGNVEVTFTGSPFSSASSYVITATPVAGGSNMTINANRLSGSQARISASNPEGVGSDFLVNYIAIGD